MDACPREPQCITRPTPTRRCPDPPLSTAPLTPRDHAGTLGVRGRPTVASPVT